MDPRIERAKEMLKEIEKEDWHPKNKREFNSITGNLIQGFLVVLVGAHILSEMEKKS